jgi:hypothetical protein
VSLTLSFPNSGPRNECCGKGAILHSVNEAEHGFKEGDLVWVEDGDGKHHPGVFVGNNEASGWFGGGPSAYVVHPEAHNAEVVSVFRITPRDE